MWLINTLENLLLPICLLLIIQGVNVNAQTQANSSDTSTVDKAVFTSSDSKNYWQIGLKLGFSIPLDRYHDLTKNRYDLLNVDGIFGGSVDYFWKGIGIGIESGFFNHEYLQAPYTGNRMYQVNWDRRDWSNFFIGIGPTFSWNLQKVQFQFSAKLGVLSTHTPAYKSRFRSLLRVEYLPLTVTSAYGSLAFSTNFLVTRNTTFSLSVGYIKSTGAEFRFQERLFIDYNDDGGYSVEEMEASPIVERSMNIVPEILTLSIGFNYRFL